MRGYMKGIIVAVFSLLAVVLGVLCALKLSERLAAYLLEQGYVSTGWAQIVAYIILFTGVMLLVKMIAKAIESAMKAVMLGWVNKALGGLIYAGLGVVICSTFLWLGREVQLIKPEQIAASKTYEYIEPVAPMVADKVGFVVPMVKNVFGDLSLFFDNVNNILPQHVDTDR